MAGLSPSQCASIVGALTLPRSCAVCGAALFPGFHSRGGSSPSVREYAESYLCGPCAKALVPIAGKRCPSCGKALISEEVLCMRCRVRHWSFDAARAVYAYRGGAAALIGAYKFGGHRSLSRLLAEVLLRELEESWPGLPVVPVPYRREKIRTRGWDQVEELCLRLEGRGVEAARVLERLPSGEQKKLGLEERFENAKIAYRVRRGAAVPSRLVLIDDVFTTGATAEACAAALKSRGASFVAFLSLAAD